MPNRPTLSPTVQAVIEQETSRIAQLGDAWQPTFENLCEIARKVLDAETAKRSEKHQEAAVRAQEASVRIGRPPLEIPPSFEELYRRCQAGELYVEDITYMLDISRNTYYKWVKILRSQKEGIPEPRVGGRSRKPAARANKSMRVKEARLLAYLLDAAPGPGSAAVVSVAEIAESMGCSASTVKSRMKALREKGLVEVQKRFGENGCRLASAYRVTQSGRRFLKRALEEKQGDE